MVADDERRRKLLLLDQQLLNNDETVGGERFFDGGYGYSENRHAETNQIQSSGKVPDLLAVAVSSESRRRRTKTKDRLRVNTISGKQFNSNPQVADYRDAQEVFEFFLGYANK